MKYTIGIGNTLRILVLLQISYFFKQYTALEGVALLKHTFEINYCKIKYIHHVYIEIQVLSNKKCMCLILSTLGVYTADSLLGSGENVTSVWALNWCLDWHTQKKIEMLHFNKLAHVLFFSEYDQIGSENLSLCTAFNIFHNIHRF